MTQDGHNLRVPGFEVPRDVKTRRQEEIDRELRRAGLPRTPKTVHWAAQKTHRARTGSSHQREGQRTQGSARTTQQAAFNTRQWYRSKGLRLDRAFRRASAVLGRLAQTRQAWEAIREAVRSIDRTGRDMAPGDFAAYARCEAAARGVNLQRFGQLLSKALQRPEELGLVRTRTGRFSTERVEAARVAWGKRFEGQRHAVRKPPRWLARAHARHELRQHDPQVVADAMDLSSRRVVRVDRVSEAVELAAKAFRYDGGRVFGAAARGRTSGLRGLDGQVTCPTLLAAEVSKGSLWKTFLQLRSERWTSIDHVVRLYKAGRRPDVELKKSDLVVIDARNASQYAIDRLVKAATKAKATVVLVSPDPVVTHDTHERQKSRKHESHER